MKMTAGIKKSLSLRQKLLSGPVFTNRQNADAVEKTLTRFAFLPDDDALRVVPVDMGEYAGAVGAAACCIDKYFIRG